MSERLTRGREKSHGGTVERIGLRERNLKERLSSRWRWLWEIVIGGKVVWRVENVIKGGSLRVLKNGGKEFSCECKDDNEAEGCQCQRDWAGPKCSLEIEVQNFGLGLRVLAGRKGRVRK